MMATTTHATRVNRSQCPRRVMGGGEARGLISLIPRSGEDECGPGRVGKAERHPDARLACRTPDYRSHSFRTARRFSLSHHQSGRASAKRYEERYDREFLETTRDCLRIAALDSQCDDNPPSPDGTTEQCLLLWRNLYNKGSSIQGLALRARREMHWRREAVRWGSP
jgi:hypothetical protein